MLMTIVTFGKKRLLFPIGIAIEKKREGVGTNLDGCSFLLC